MIIIQKYIFISALTIGFFNTKQPTCAKVGGFEKSKDEWRQLFVKYADMDEDGVVEYWELVRFLKIMGMNPTDAEVEKIMKEEFQKNNVITFNELYGWVLKQPRLMELYDTFRVFDEDKSGYLDIGELKHLISSISDDKELKEFFTFIDADKDGKIDYKELMNIFFEGQSTK